MSVLHPSKSLYERMVALLSPEELQAFIEYLEAVKEDGFGGVSLEIENHHPARLKVSGHISKLLTKLKAKTYKPE